MNIVKFKSEKINFEKECVFKNNTVRKIDFSDDRFTKLKDFEKGILGYLYIQIINKSNVEQTLLRRVLDVTEFDGYYIITFSR